MTAASDGRRHKNPEPKLETDIKGGSVNGREGKVTSIIYVIVVFCMCVRTSTGPEAHRAIVLFDTCNVWLGLQTAQ